MHTCSNRIFWRVVQSTGANIKVWMDARNYKGHITKVRGACKREHSTAGWPHHVVTRMFRPLRALNTIHTHTHTRFVLQDVLICGEVHAQRLPVALVQLLQLSNAQDVVQLVSCILYFNLKRIKVCVALKHWGFWLNCNVSTHWTGMCTKTLHSLLDNNNLTTEICLLTVYMTKLLPWINHFCVLALKMKALKRLQSSYNKMMVVFFFFFCVCLFVVYTSQPVATAADLKHLSAFSFRTVSSARVGVLR